MYVHLRAPLPVPWYAPHGMINTGSSISPLKSHSFVRRDPAKENIHILYYRSTRKITHFTYIHVCPRMNFKAGYIDNEERVQTNAERTCTRLLWKGLHVYGIVSTRVGSLAMRGIRSAGGGGARHNIPGKARDIANSVAEVQTKKQKQK